MKTIISLIILIGISTNITGQNNDTVKYHSSIDKCFTFYYVEDYFVGVRFDPFVYKDRGSRAYQAVSGTPPLDIYVYKPVRYKSKEGVVNNFKNYKILYPLKGKRFYKKVAKKIEKDEYFIQTYEFRKKVRKFSMYEMLELKEFLQTMYE